VDEESLVAGGHHVAGLLVGTVTDRGHGLLALEATTLGIVNTLGLSPRSAIRILAWIRCCGHECRAYPTRMNRSDW
jgi:hypothetical protein